jgi:hypothetical protein
VNHFGIALGKRESQIAILTEEGELINGRLRTERHLSWSSLSRLAVSSLFSGLG